MKRSLVWLAVLASCGPDVSFLPFPPSDDAQSAAFVQIKSTGIKAYAIPLDGQSYQLPDEHEEDDRITFEAWTYVESLETLRLPLGGLETPRFAAETALLPEATAGLYRTTLGNAGATGWALTEFPSEQTAGLRYRIPYGPSIREGLVVQLHSRLGVRADAETWPDVSGGGYDFRAISSRGVSFTDDRRIGDDPIVICDAGGGYEREGTALPPASPRTIVIVAQLREPRACSLFGYWDPANEQRLALEVVVDDGNYLYGAWTPAGKVASNVSATTRPTIHVLRTQNLDGAPWRDRMDLRIHGQQAELVAGGDMPADPLAGLGDMRLCRFPLINPDCALDVAQVLVYDRALPDATVMALERELADDYQIPLAN